MQEVQIQQHMHLVPSYAQPSFPSCNDVEFHLVAKSCCKRFIGIPSSFCIPCRQLHASCECLKCPTILFPKATTSAMLRCERTPMCVLCMVNLELQSPPSLWSRCAHCLLVLRAPTLWGFSSSQSSLQMRMQSMQCPDISCKAHKSDISEELL